LPRPQRHDEPAAEAAQGEPLHRRHTVAVEQNVKACRVRFDPADLPKNRRHGLLEQFNVVGPDGRSHVAVLDRFRAHTGPPTAGPTTVSKMTSTRDASQDLPFAKELFEAADRMRGSVESSEYKHLVLGLLFLKYISDAFERRRSWLDAASRNP